MLTQKCCFSQDPVFDDFEACSKKLLQTASNAKKIGVFFNETNLKHCFTTSLEEGVSEPSSLGVK